MVHFKHGGDADYTDGLANSHAQFIEFYHVASNKSIAFKAFVTKFSDGLASDWSEDDDNYGRMDPLPTFKKTRRVIGLSWDVPSYSFEEAKENLRKISLLMAMHYPAYKELDNSTSIISTSPILKLKFMNLITDNKQIGDTAKDSGLLGYTDGIIYEPDFEQGVFTENTSIYPKLAKFSCNFKVLHQNKLGWDGKGEQREHFNKFPYGIDARQDISSPRPILLDISNVNFNLAQADTSVVEERSKEQYENDMFSSRGIVA